MAVKIRLKRFGKKFNPQYRIVVMNSKAKRDGYALEEVGKYQPMQEPSFMEVKSERVQYWLGVGAQPTEQVQAILKATGDWQKFKGLPGSEGTLKQPKEKEAFVAPEGKSVVTEAITPKKKGGDSEKASEEAPKDSSAAEKDAAKEAPAAEAEKAE
ncbi:30S ribosomal protein S16 [Arthrobacter castelli]|uniref:30S ribosomal protein S16 n=1 Tax=Arthrobacter castelli TaxID=271431 RepID=UPI000427C2F1|nr:30S ribosomal protein S16 [Arthrobacter castelli]